jgi:hypothetical protein
MGRVMRSRTPHRLKTYTWQTELDRARAAQALELKRYSYVSLFGLNSLEGLKLSIFENLEFLDAPPASSHWTMKRRRKLQPVGESEKSKSAAVGRDRGLKLAMLWCSHIAVRLIFRNVAN